MKAEFGDDPFEGFLVRDTNQDDGRHKWIIGALRERVCHFKCRMICLDDLLLDWQIIPDEEVKLEIGLGIHLVHELKVGYSALFVKNYFAGRHVSLVNREQGA